MKNPIISELRRIRDENARRHHYDLEAMARDWMELEPWMERKTDTLHGHRLVPLTSLRKTKRAAAHRKN